MKLPGLGIGVVAALVATLGPAGPAGSVSGPRSTYIVQLAVPPVAAQHGSISALAATSRLDRSERQVLSTARAGRARVVHRYRSAFSGFAARLTTREATGLAATAGVAAVTPDTVSHPLAHRRLTPPGDGALGYETPAFLGLPAGIWGRLGGPAKAGEGVKIGVIDTGIYPEHPSFADTPVGHEGKRYDGPAYAPPTGWKGTCQAGANFPSTACNNKLIGARYFVEGFGAKNVKAGDFLSPRDANGHGSHVAATAAGNYGVVPKMGGHNLGIAKLSGIAPRAWIAAYKVCWTGRAATGDTVDGTCMASDAVAAIDAAVADGVDVINYSVGSATSAVFGPVERAFLGAAAAGVFVANAAGNNGPDPGTIGSPTGVPWVTSVAAIHAVATAGDRVAAFSSRGPEAAVPDIAKPDLGAPGVNILGADTPSRATGQRRGETFQIISGTSMAAPEVAGAAALLAQLEPGWSPAAIKSALMTSADPEVLTSDGTTPAGPLDVGSGRIDPNRAATPGLVVDTPVGDYVRYLKAQAPAEVPDPAIAPLAAADLNLPSVAFSRFTEAGFSTVRTFISVDRGPQSWAVSIEAPAGVLGTVAPARFDIAPGATQAVTLSLALAGAPSDVYTSGAIVLTNTTDQRTVRLPVSVKPVKALVRVLRRSG